MNLESLFTEALRDLGGKAPNKHVLQTMQDYLSSEGVPDTISKDEYLNIRKALIKVGLVQISRGRGGVVSFTDKFSSKSETVVETNTVVDPFPKGWRA